MQPTLLFMLFLLLAGCRGGRQSPTSTMDPSQRVYATLILKAPSGQSVRDQSATAATIDSLQPDSATTARAVDYLKKAGFQIEQPGVTLSISGPASLFEQTFGLKLSPYEQAGQTYYRSDKPARIPAAARSFIDTVTLAEPQQFFN